MAIIVDVDVAQEGSEMAKAAIVVSGELDLSCSDELLAAVRRVCELGPALVELNLASTTFIDSSGLRAVIAAERAAEESGGRLVLDGTSAAVEKVLEITGLLDRYREAKPD